MSEGKTQKHNNHKELMCTRQDSCTPLVLIYKVYLVSHIIYLRRILIGKAWIILLKV